MSDRFIVLDTFGLTPDKLTLYKTFVQKNEYKSEIVTTHTTKDKIAGLKNIYGDQYETEKRYHNFEISTHARKRMLQKINWLYFMAKGRTKKTISGKEIFNFKINFITLTLPAKQVHNTAQITKECLNQLITELRNKYNMQNFVWRLEFQQNGNVHYHIVTDVFIDFYILQKMWNRIIGKLGYTERYTQKHALMSLSDYVKEYSTEKFNDFEKLAKRYATGKKTMWKVPNSVDVKSVSGKQNIAFYISKYFSKKANMKMKCNELDTKDNSMGLRLWFCSRSLSKLEKVVDYCEAFKEDVLSAITSTKGFFTSVQDYCTTIYYRFKDLVAEAKQVLHPILYNYAISTGYEPCIT